MNHLMLMIEVYKKLLGNYKYLERIRNKQALLYDEGKFNEARELNREIIERHISIDAYEYVINCNRAIESEELHEQ